MTSTTSEIEVGEECETPAPTPPPTFPSPTPPTPDPLCPKDLRVPCHETIMPCFQMRGDTRCLEGSCHCHLPTECAAPSELLWPLYKPSICVLRDGGPGTGRGNITTWEFVRDDIAR